MININELRQSVKPMTDSALRKLYVIYGWYGDERGVNTAEQRKRQVVREEMEYRKLI